MKFFVTPLDNEDGVIIIIVLFVLVLMTLIGLAATTTTSIDLQIAGNDKFYKVAFYTADAGAYTTPKLISTAVDTAVKVEGSDLGAITYLTDATTAFRQILGFDAYDGGTPDITFTLDHAVKVDIERTGQEILVGGGAEFAAGAEGVGPGSTGGVALYYDIDSAGTGPSNASSNVKVSYRKLPGIPGGL